MKLLTFLSLFLLAAGAQAAGYIQAIPEGSYKGVKRAQGKGTIHLIVKNYAGCDGCFTVIEVDAPDLSDRGVALAAYAAFPRNRISIGGGKFSSNKYALVPMGTTIPQDRIDGKEHADEEYDGDLTLPNQHPSMMIDILDDGGIGTEDVKFKLTSAQSGNFGGIPITADFLKTKESPYELWDPASGEYRAPGKLHSTAVISIKPSNSADGSRSANITWNGTSRIPGGNFLLSEKAPDVFTFNAVQYLSYGEKVKNLPTFLVMFFKMHGERMVLMVSPFQATNVHKLIYKGN